MKYQLEKQEKDYFCGPACLQAVLKAKGIEIQQEEIARQIKCTEKGILNWKEVEKFLLAYNLKFEFFPYNETPFNEPDFFLQESLGKKDVLIAYPNEKGKHVCLLEEFFDPILTVRNPKDSEIYQANLYDLTRKMFQARTGGFGLISKL